MIYVLTAAFMGLDCLTGLVKSLATGTFDSAKMRTGLWNKASLILVITLAVLVDSAQGYLDLGITVPLTGAACVYICLMELTSILGHLSALNPKLVPERLAQLFRRDQ